jgi:hypothetical protein
MRKIFIFTFILLISCNYNHKQATNISTSGNIAKDTSVFNSDSVVNDLKQKLDDSFVIKTQSCFVIASNLSENETNKIIKHTIASAEECFYNDYFTIKPDEIIKIFLFKNKETYINWAKKLYDDEDDLSPFGYYKPSMKAMLMNISTGSGTLVHEMTHAFVRYDFPDIPSWFNEGLGSLYERCSLQNKEILGYVNWRLPSLQNAIENKSYTSLGKLIRTSDDEFYGERSGFNYSQARYLCLYMQEKGVLKIFYKNFRDRYNEDNTGRIFLEEALNEKLKVIEKEFVDWAKKLKEED